MTQLRLHYPDIKAAGSDVLLVTFFPPDRTQNWARQHDLPYHLAADVSRRAYFAYGLREGNTAEIMGPRNWGAALRSVIRTGQMPSYTQHVNQLGGYFIVDSKGKVLYAQAGQASTDQPDIKKLAQLLTVEV